MAYRAVEYGRKKRKQLADGDEGALEMLRPAKKRSKYPDEELYELRDYMMNNLYTRDSPLKNDRKRKRDLNGASFLPCV